MIGSHAAAYWSLQGHQVTVLDNLTRSTLFGLPAASAEYLWKFLQQCQGVRLVRGDVRRAEDVAEAVAGGVDVILHAAGQPGVGFSLQHPEEDFSINAQGTLCVLEMARQRSPGAIVLYCSTNKVYGTNVDALACREEERRYMFERGIVGVEETMPVDLTGHTPYGVSKLTGELYVQDYAHTYGMRTAVFRLSCIFGTRQFGVEDQGWISHFAISTLLGRPLTIYGNGKQVRDALYVDDLVQLFDQFIHSSLPHGVFNVGGGPGQTVSLLELLDALQDLTGRRSAVRFLDPRPSDQRIYISNTQKVERQVGWRPRTSVSEGLQNVVAWVKEHQALFEDS